MLSVVYVKLKKEDGFSNTMILWCIHPVWIGRFAADGQVINRQACGFGHIIDSAMQHALVGYIYSTPQAG